MQRSTLPAPASSDRRRRDHLALAPDLDCDPVSGTGEQRAQALRAAAAAIRQAIQTDDLPAGDDVAVWLSRLATQLAMTADFHGPRPWVS